MSDVMRLIQEIGSDSTSAVSVTQLSATAQQAPAAFPSWRCWIGTEETD